MNAFFFFTNQAENPSDAARLTRDTLYVKSERPAPETRKKGPAPAAVPIHKHDKFFISQNLFRKTDTFTF